MPETTTTEAYEPMTFDKIKIGLASPEKNPAVVQGRSFKTRNHQLQNIKTGERWFIL